MSTVLVAKDVNLKQLISHKEASPAASEIKQQYGFTSRFPNECSVAFFCLRSNLQALIDLEMADQKSLGLYCAV